LSLTFALNAEVISLNRIADLPFNRHERCWLLVDLDNCLFESKQALGHANWFYDLVHDREALGMSQQEAIKDAYPLWIMVQERCQVQPIEKDFVTLIQNLQQRGIVVMGLTHRQPSVASATLQQVRSLGLDLTLTAPEIQPCITSNGPTLFCNGILFVGDYNKKSCVLSQFLKQIKEMPHHIVFIDDKKYNVSELEPMLCDLGIEYLGIHYTAIDIKPPIYDRHLADVQFYYFQRILSNAEAKLLDAQ